MHREGHTGTNALLYAPVAYFLVANDLMLLFGLGLALVLGLAAAPDLDMDVPFVKHRGITHTVWFALLVGAACAGFLWVALPNRGTGVVVAGFAFGTLGIVGHLVGDVITPMGLKPFAPVSDYHVTLGLTTAGNDLANELLFVVGAVALGGALVVGTVGIGQLLVI